jgi:hypothetical protein
LISAAIRLPPTFRTEAFAQAELQHGLIRLPLSSISEFGEPAIFPEQEQVAQGSAWKRLGRFALTCRRGIEQFTRIYLGWRRPP